MSISLPAEETERNEVPSTMTHESRFSMAAFQNADTPFQPAYAWIWNDQIESAELRRRLDGLRRAGIRTV